MIHSPLIKLAPLYQEDRGNLRFLGVEAPVNFLNLKNFLVIHIKTDMPTDEMNMLNKRLRSVFGQETIVFTTACDIKFCCLEQVTPEEAEKLSHMGDPAIVANKVMQGKELLDGCKCKSILD
jgi:hypothetical protein